jgi:hypothetical protein
MRSKHEVLCAAAGNLAAERSEADNPAKAHKTPLLLRIYKVYTRCVLKNAASHISVIYGSI